MPALLLKLANQNQHSNYNERGAGDPGLPGLYVIATGLLCVNLLFRQTKYAGLGLIIVALGVPVYYIWRILDSRQKAQAGH